MKEQGINPTSQAIDFVKTLGPDRTIHGLKNKFIEIRLKRGDRYTNYVDLGELFVQLTKKTY